jgi:hypothetical protein
VGSGLLRVGANGEGPDHRTPDCCRLTSGYSNF